MLGFLLRALCDLLSFDLLLGLLCFASHVSYPFLAVAGLGPQELSRIGGYRAAVFHLECVNRPTISVLAYSNWYSAKEITLSNIDTALPQDCICNRNVKMIDATPSKGLTYLETSFGKPFTRKGFGTQFKRWCVSAGLPHCSAHGLRKAGATVAAERGATPYQLMAIYGWKSLSQALGYTKAAEQKRLAAAAMHLLAERDESVSLSADAAG